MGDAKSDALEKLRSQVAEANQAAKANPIWAMDSEELAPMVEAHTLGTTHSGWKNPYPAGDPRSLLLEYQFVPFHDRSRFKFQLQSRQTGKDFTIEGEAVEDSLERTTEWMIAAPSERQALDSLEQAKLWAEGFEHHIKDVIEEREGSTSQHLLKSAEILFENGSRMRAVPGKPDTVRGRSANIILTEFDFFEQPAATWRALLPSITNPLRGGEKKVRIGTTPNGQGGAGHKIWTKGDGERMKWSRHLVTIYTAVLMGLPVDVAQIKEALDDPDGFAQEFLCQFLDGSNVLLPYELIALAESMEATESWSLADAITALDTYLGVDFGRTNDPTVCWTLQRVGDILWTREVLVLEDISTPEQFRILSDRIRAASRTCFDYTGPGIGLGDLMVEAHGEWKPEEHKMGKVELCTFTAKFKRELFPRLRQAFVAPTKLRIPVSTVIREDLHEMKQIISNGEYSYWAPRTKAGHSDRCTALALANRAAGDLTAWSFPPRSGGKRTRNREGAWTDENGDRSKIDSEGGFSLLRVEGRAGGGDAPEALARACRKPFRRAAGRRPGMKRGTAMESRPRGGALGRMRQVMNRALASVSYRFHIAAANTWRDNYNPLRSLTIQRAVCLLEEGERGAYADLQWTYRYIEMQDATLGALVERRTSAIQKLDWGIKVRDDIPAGKERVAQLQEAALKDAYGRIGNLSAAFEAMAMASFRGFTHLEKIEDAEGWIVELAPVDQWFWCRQGLYGGWAYNRSASFGSNRGEAVDLSRFMVREVSRPINRVALVCFVRKGLSQKDWDGFIESYGIPAVFILMPSNVPTGKEDEYLDLAEQVSSDARGVLPAGSDVKTVDNGARGVNPFKDHVDYQDAQVVLRGTGGKLTMLAESGTGTLAGNAHSETFDEIAKAEAAEISEIFRKQLDTEILARVTPGEPALAYFELAANEETDTKAIVQDAARLKVAGFRVRREWLEEKTGYQLEAIDERPPADPNGTPVPAEVGAPGDVPLLNREQATAGFLKSLARIANREPGEDPRAAVLKQALAKDLQPLGVVLAEAMQADDPAAALEAIDWEKFTEAGASSDALAAIMAGAWIEGAAEANPKEQKA